MSERLRILHAIRSDGFAGVEQFVLRLARAQQQRGDEVTVIGGATEPMRAGLDPVGVGHVPAARTDDVTRAVRRLARDVDVVNTHMTAADLGTVLALAPRRTRPSVVATRHFAKPRGRIGPVPLASVVRRGIDAQIAISTAVAATIDGTSTVVHPGIDARSAPDTRSRERTVLIGQRLEPEKHTHVGLRAFAASGLVDDGWSLEIAGDGSEREALTALSASLGVEAAVRFLGFRSDLPELMGRAALLVAPCPVEGFGLSLLEAMASGLPVVAAAAAGHLDTLSGLDPRALYAPDDVAEAAAHLRSLAGDEPGRAALAHAALERQRREFSLEAQADGTDAVYRSVL